MRSTLLFAAALSLAACATTRPAAKPAEFTLGPRAPADACSAFAGAHGYVLDDGETTERQVLGLSCFDRFERPALEKRGYVQLHARFDDRLFDPVAAAVMIVACVGDGACRLDGEAESLGQMTHYAKTLSISKLQVALQASRVRSDVQDAFVIRAQAARDVILAESAQLDPRRHRLYVELPEQIRARQKAHWQAFGAFYKRLDNLVPRVDLALKQFGGADYVMQQLLAETAKLRDDYLTKCASQRSRTVQECLTGPIARPLTERLVQLSIRLGDPLLARAEHALLGLGPDQGTMAQQIASAQAAAIEEEQVQFTRFTEAKADGVDDATLETAFGLPPPADVPGLAWKVMPDLASVRSQLRRMAAVDVVRGTVRAVQNRGDTMEIFFDQDTQKLCPESVTETISTNETCVEDAATPVNRLFLALNEAKPLLVGNRLEAVVDRESRRAAAVQVFQSRKAEQLIQVRAARLK